MNRHGNLYSQLFDMDNIVLADRLASRGKADQYGVINHRKNADANLKALQQMIIDKTYKTSAYKTFIIREPKEREIFCLPYFPDRIMHHNILIVIKPILTETFTSDSYASIEGKGIHSASFALRKALKNEAETKYCLKLDVQKFYPSIDHVILKQLLRKKIKDVDMLCLLDEIIDSADGVPIGNYLSQFFANFYLTYFDHYLKETLRVPFYFRYKDDMVFLSDSKEILHQLFEDVKQYLHEKLKLSIKYNYQIFPVKDRGIDFVGYVHYHDHVLLRKTIKQNFARKMSKGADYQTVASYYGWAKHCNSNNLLNKLLNVQLQRPKCTTTKKERVHRRQNKNRTDFKPRDKNLRVQN